MCCEDRQILRHSRAISLCLVNILFLTVLGNLQRSAHMYYWHWLAGCGDGERQVGVKTAGDSQKEPVVVALK